MEGDVEFNDDEDDINSMGVVTRRLNLTTNATGNFRATLNSQSQFSQKENEHQKLYGQEADELFLKCFQFILKKQCRWLIEEMKFPSVYQDLLKRLWIRFLKVLEDRKNDECDSQTQGNAKRKKFGLSLLSSISLLYLAALHLKLPVFTCDFIRWICSMKILYFKANLHLPAHWRKQLPNYYLQVLEGGRPPNNGQLLHKIAQTCFELRFSQDFGNSLPFEALILKLVLLTRLPPHAYFYTKELIKLIDGTDMGKFTLIEHDKTHFTKLHLYAELRTVAYFILAIKWKLLDGDEFIARYIDVWLDLDQTGSDPISRDQAITALSFPAEEGSTHAWTKAKTDHYLDWLETKFLPHSTVGELDSLTIDQRIGRKKLYAMFPLSNELPHESESRSLTFIEDTQEKYLSIADALSDTTLKPRLRSTEIAAKLEGNLIQKLAPFFAVSSHQLLNCIECLQKYVFEIWASDPSYSIEK